MPSIWFVPDVYEKKNWIVYVNVSLESAFFMQPIPQFALLPRHSHTLEALALSARFLWQSGHVKPVISLLYWVRAVSASDQTESVF